MTAQLQLGSGRTATCEALSEAKHKAYRFTWCHFGMPMVRWRVDMVSLGWLLSIEVSEQGNL